MLHQNLLILLTLMFLVFVLIMLGRKLGISAPLALLTGGLFIGFIPGMPVITISPQLVFLIFLPPLLYEAAWYTSWNDFWKWRRAIGLLGFGLVIFNALIVAFVADALIPGFTLAMGFLLGGIISPPDAVAATSVLKGLPVPKRIVAILEGESLINDASSLVVFRFALAAVMTGRFVFAEAAKDFVLVTIAGAAIGIIIANVFYALHRFLPTTPDIDTALTFISPYVMYLTAEQFHYSGVMAVVSGGLFLSYRSHEILTHQSRVQATGAWSTLIFVLNSLVFILMGLQLPVIASGISEYSLFQAVMLGIGFSVLCIIIRLVWVYPATFIPRLLSKEIREKESAPDKKGVFLVGWAGMRGVVTLAAALNIPLLLPDGNAFPHRNLIIFISFIVILVTLLLHGLTLPRLAKKFELKNAPEDIPEEEQEAAVMLRLNNISLITLNEYYETNGQQNELIDSYKKYVENNHNLTLGRLSSAETDEAHRTKMEEFRRIRIYLLQEQRKELARLRSEKIYSEDEIRKQMARIDLEEMRLRE